MNEILELCAQFSQVARHEARQRKSEIPYENLGVSQRITKDEVALIRECIEHCHAPEKLGPDHSVGTAWKADCETLAAMELRRRYSREATSHRNMLSREKSRGAIVSAEFRGFRSFLRHVGPMPAKGATLDRINNADPEYAPGKVRWADKRTQNSNKGDSLIFFYSRTGETYTTSRLAALRKVTPATIRKQRERGWSDDEIIEGRRSQNLTPTTSASRTHHCSPPPRDRPSEHQPLSAEQIRFKEMADYCEWHREEYGEENIPSPLEALREILGVQITEEQYERRFRSFWPEYRPHVDFWNLAPSQQALVEKIDPDYVEAQRRRRASKEQLGGLL